MASKGVILMTYGSATVAENVPAYINHIYKDKPPEGLIADFENRYRLVGRSPLVGITEDQAKMVQERLGDKYIVKAAMLHSDPFIEDVVMDLKKAGVQELRGVILSPQFSSFIMDGYLTTLKAAAAKAGFPASAVSVAAPWPTEPHFIELLATRVRQSLARLEEKYGARIPVLFTTHSLPKRVVDKDPNYLEQLKQTVAAVLSEIRPRVIESYSCYQSAGHTPEEWLKPDLTDILAALQRKNAHAVLIVPIQFLADHLEILYDLDIAAKQQCDERGIAYHRIELPNTTPLFVEALAAVAEGKPSTIKRLLTSLSRGRF